MTYLSQVETAAFPQYGWPRKIWRLMYPVLIFVAIQMLVQAIAAPIMMFAKYPSYSNVLDIAELTQALADFLLEYAIYLTFLSNLLTFAIILPMWQRTQPKLQSYTTEGLSKTIIGVILFAPGVGIILSLVNAVSGVTESSDYYLQSVQLIMDTPLYMQILSIVIAAPIVEELVMRGVVLNRALYIMPRWAAILVSSAMFGFVHFSIPQGSFAFLLGIMLSVFYLRYRSLGVCIAAHIAINAVSTLLNYVQGIEIIDGVVTTADENAIGGVVIMAACFAASIASFFVLLKRQPPAVEKNL